jgi:trimeric autotransporter adhesin
VLNGDAGNDVLYGEEDADHLFGGDDDDVIDGGGSNDELAGDAGNDLLQGGEGDDVLTGGTGNDELSGGAGNDIYRFNVDDGLDMVIDNGMPDEVNSVVFVQGITTDMVSLAVIHGSLTVRLATDTHGIQLGDVSLNDVLGLHAVDRFAFADGNSLTYAQLFGPVIDVIGTLFDDSLGGTNLDDRFFGGSGNDELGGGTGSDTYFYNVGDGQDVINDVTVRVSSGGGEGQGGEGGEGGEGEGAVGTVTTTETNRVVFGGGISSSDLTLDVRTDPFDASRSSLVLRTGSEGDEVLFSTFDRADVLGPHAIELFEFSEGPSLGYAQLIARGFDVTGSDENDTILGTNVVDRVSAGAGNDLVQSGAGDDVLDGGSGNDTLQGGQGNDTYAFGLGSGNDTVIDSQGFNTVTFQAGIAPSDARVNKSGHDLVVSINGGADQLAVAFYFLSPLFHLREVRFADGTVWDDTFVENLTKPAITGTNASDRLVGTGGADRLFGLGGDDQLDGLAGNDLLDGGPNADFMAGGAGNDTYVADDAGDIVIEQSDDGIDTVQSSITYTLGDHVENLNLTGTAAINGIGNELDNRLVGNGAANVLFGGSGNDTYVIGDGDGVVEQTGAGIDAVETAVSYQLSAEVENLTVVGSRSVTGRGNELDNVLAAPGSVSTLAGGLGDDLYLIGPGDDLDVVVEAPGGGLDTVRASRNVQLAENVERLELVDPLLLPVTDGDPLAHLLLPSYQVVDRHGNPFGLTGIGNSLANILVGTGTANVLDGGAGNDSLQGLGGADTYLFARGYGQDIVNDFSIAGEIDTIQLGSDVLPGDLHVYQRDFDLVLTITGTDDELTVASFFDAPGYDQKQVLFADGTTWDATALLAFAVSAGYRTITETESNHTRIPAGDTTVGTSGDDVLDSAFPASLQGLAGDDEYRFGDSLIPGVVFAIEAPGEGIDTVQSYFDYTLDANVEDLILAEVNSPVLPNPRRGIGNELDNIIIGNTGDNILDGAAGNDVLIGGLFYVARENILVGSNGSDILVGGEGDDTLIPFVPNTRRAGFLDLHQGFLIDSNFIDQLPNEPDDLLIGGSGNDTYILFNANETVFEAPEGGIDVVKSIVDYMLGEQVENLTLLNNERGVFAVRGTGNVLDNVIIGNLGANELLGQDGDDTLWGGVSRPDDIEDPIPQNAGNDLLIGGAGDDTYLFNVGDGIDRVEDVAATGEGNRIQFGAGITSADLFFTQDSAARTLVIQVGSSGADKLILNDFDPTDRYGSLVVAELAFADGNTVTLRDLFGGPVNHAPTVGNPLNDQIVFEGTSFSIEVPANTFADPDAGDTLTYSATQADGSALPSWMSFNATTRTFTGTPDDGQVGTLNLAVKATDSGGLSATSAFALTVQNINEAPTVAHPLTNQTVPEDAPYGIQVPANTFADPDGGDTLTYSATQADGSALPTWVSFDAATRTFTGTPDDAQVGTLNLAVKATDSGGLSATSAFALTVQNVNEAPTVAHPLTNQTVLEDAPFSIQVPANTFADPDAGDTLTYSATQADGSALPSWVSFNATTRTFTGTPDDGQVGILNVAVKSTDAGGLSATSAFALTVQNVNEAPIVANPLPDQSTQAGQAYTFTVPTTAFADPDPGDTLAYTATLANGNPLPGWLTFNASTRTFSGTPTGSDAGLLSLKVTARDAGSLTAADVFDLTVTTGDQTLTGTAGNDVLTGGAGNDHLFGLAGNDTLTGGAGNDLLDGGTGADTLRGGLGNDTYIVDNTGDIVNENANEGTDTVQSSLTYTLGANVENLTLTGTAAINGTGNALDNVLLGNGGNNTLTGGAGNDRLDGGAGNDTMVGGTGNDTYLVNQTGDIVTENANEGTDTVESSITFTLGSNVENLTLTGTANINGTGSSVNNVLLGNSGNNALDGGSGNDTVDGGSGNDTVQGGSGDDTVFGGLGDDNVSAGSGNDVLDGGDGIDTLDGGSGDDILRGGAGNDTISGGSGADQFTGGTGNDTLNGGTGNDLYNFARGDGQDTINDSDSFPGNQDKLQLGTTINPMDLVLSRQANDLRITIHGTINQITIQNWYTSPTTNHIEDIQAGNGQHLMNTQVNQLIQAMATFSQQTGLTWDQGIDARPQDVQAVLATSWH